MKKEVTRTRIVCDYCDKDLGAEDWGSHKCCLCGKDVCLKHLATVYYADITASVEKVVCRECLPKALYNGHTDN